MQIQGTAGAERVPASEQLCVLGSPLNLSVNRAITCISGLVRAVAFQDWGGDALQCTQKASYKIGRGVRACLILCYSQGLTDVIIPRAWEAEWMILNLNLSSASSWECDQGPIT